MLEHKLGHCRSELELGLSDLCDLPLWCAVTIARRWVGPFQEEPPDQLGQFALEKILGLLYDARWPWEEPRSVARVFTEVLVELAREPEHLPV